MEIENQYLLDIETILSHRHDNGADLWATPDNKLLKGSPFSTFDSVGPMSILWTKKVERLCHFF